MCTVVHQADTEEEGTVNDNDQWRTRWKRNTLRDKEYIDVCTYDVQINETSVLSPDAGVIIS